MLENIYLLEKDLERTIAARHALDADRCATPSADRSPVERGETVRDARVLMRIGWLVIAWGRHSF